MPGIWSRATNATQQRVSSRRVVWEKYAKRDGSFVDVLLERRQELKPGKVFWYSDVSAHLVAAVLGLRWNGLTALVDDSEITRSPMERMSAPTVPEQPVDILTDEQLVRLIPACQGLDLRGSPRFGADQVVHRHGCPRG